MSLLVYLSLEEVKVNKGELSNPGTVIPTGRRSHVCYFISEQGIFQCQASMYFPEGSVYRGTCSQSSGQTLVQAGVDQLWYVTRPTLWVRSLCSAHPCLGLTRILAIDFWRSLILWSFGSLHLARGKSYFWFSSNFPYSWFCNCRRQPAVYLHSYFITFLSGSVSHSAPSTRDSQPPTPG